MAPRLAFFVLSALNCRLTLTSCSEAKRDPFKRDPLRPFLARHNPALPLVRSFLDHFDHLLQA